MNFQQHPFSRYCHAQANVVIFFICSDQFRSGFVLIYQKPSLGDKMSIIMCLKISEIKPERHAEFLNWLGEIVAVNKMFSACQ